MIRIDELLMKLHRLIDEKRLTQEQLGKILGVKQSGVSRRLSGKTHLKIKEINILAGLLDQLEVPASAESIGNDRLSVLARLTGSLVCSCGSESAVQYLRNAPSCTLITRVIKNLR